MSLFCLEAKQALVVYSRQVPGEGEDLTRFRSARANFGPLRPDWKDRVPLVPKRPSRVEETGDGEGGGSEFVPAYPLMTCYKVFEVDFPYLGLLSRRVESFVVNALRDQLLLHHRRAIASIDSW